MDTLEPVLTMLPGLLNPPDLVLLAIILVSACMGASRGLVRTACNFLGRTVAMTGAALAARLLAPVMARALVTPIIGDIFEIRATDLLSRLPGAAQALQTQATEMAASMAQNLAFSLLFFIFLFAMNMLVHMISRALKLVTRIKAIGVLDSLAGFVLGAVIGLVLCVFGLFALRLCAPGTFEELGWLSPARLAGTTLTAYLLGLLPAL